jgi:hypothetical protein
MTTKLPSSKENLKYVLRIVALHQNITNTKNAFALQIV